LISENGKYRAGNNPQNFVIVNTISKNGKKTSTLLKSGSLQLSSTSVFSANNFSPLLPSHHSHGANFSAATEARNFNEASLLQSSSATRCLLFLESDNVSASA
jgi:hypothetical protein